MDLQNLLGTKTEVKILLRFDRNSKFLTAQDCRLLLRKSALTRRTFTERKATMVQNSLPSVQRIASRMAITSAAAAEAEDESLVKCPILRPGRALLFP